MIHTYQIYLNGDCNLRCKYCYEHNKNRGVNNRTSVLSFVKAIIKEVTNSGNSEPFKDVVIDFIGGEPFLHVSLLREAIELIISECVKHKIVRLPEFTISTNGTLFDQEDVRDFIETYGRYLTIGISIDGTKECHDKNRIDVKGQGSWDKAIEGWKYLQNHVCINKLSVKATFNHDNIMQYAESVIALIKLGFRSIHANTVYEEQWTMEDSVIIYDQLMFISRYMQDHNLMDKVKFDKINPKGMDFKSISIGATRDKNHCGSCEYMRALGFDNKIYGCHRFACADINPIGYLDTENDEIVITNNAFIEEVCHHHDDNPEECKNCAFLTLCGTCAALPYELGITPKEWFNKKPQCGFTNAVGWAICHTMIDLGMANTE